MLFFSDFLLAFISWFTFGPPLTTSIATSFDIRPFEYVFNNRLQFLLPFLITISTLYFLGFYKTLIRFFDPVDSIGASSFSSLIFGSSWAFLYIYFNPIAYDFLFVIFLQGVVLSAVFLTLVNLSRVVAKYFLQPIDSARDAVPIVIYGAGSAGQELSYLKYVTTQKVANGIMIVGFVVFIFKIIFWYWDKKRENVSD